MNHEIKHPSDAQLLRAADGELEFAQADDVQQHLIACGSCRERARALQTVSADFAQAYLEQAAAAAAPPQAYARARLKMRLAEASNRQQQSRWLGLGGRGWATACLAILMAAIGIRFAYQQSRLRDSQSALAEAGGPLVPDARLTPGAVQALSVGQVCAAGGPKESRPPTQLQRAVFHEYGMDDAAPQEYEVDHLITPALGGSDDIRNLWPEPYSSEWNAHVKDELEDYLHDQVCRGKLDLPTAQREISTNWISAYQKYFHTDKPLRRNSRLITDPQRHPNS